MVQSVKISELHVADYNPRIELKPGMMQYEALKKSIQDNGLVDPIIWNKRTGNVVGGHQRLEVVKSLGWEMVECSVIDISEEEEKVLNVALNKIKGKWDYDKLGDLLKEFDYEVAQSSGFSADEIALILANNSDIDDEVYFDDDGGDWEGEFIGGSWVVTLIFANTGLAENWASGEGYGDQIREGSSTTLIRMDD